MNGLQFEWDAAKAEANLRKHGVSFEEAATVFADPKLLRVFDLEHSADEDREIVIGFSEKLRLLMVVSTERYEAIRIISARAANTREAERYRGQN